MPSLRAIVVAVLMAAWCIGAHGLEAAASLSASSSASCSSDELRQAQTQLADIQASLAASSSATTVPTSCMAVFTPDASKVQTGELCAADCLVWLESVADIPTCGDAEMQEYQRLMAAYQTQCSQRKRVRLQADEDTQQATMRLRGLAATDAAEAHDDKRRLATAGGAGETDRGWRKLSVKGLMDALLVVTLNNAL